MATEVEETIKRIQAHKGVIGVVIVNHEGIPIKSSLDNATSVLYAGLIGQLAEKARNVVREMDSTNELTFLRVRSRKHEILIAPDRVTMYVRMAIALLICCNFQHPSKRIY